MNTKSLITAAGLALGIASAAQAQSVKLGYNGLENGITSEHTIRTRLFSGVDVNALGFTIHYNGLNETDGSTHGINGLQQVHAGTGSVRPLMLVPTSDSKLLKPQVGFRDFNLVKLFDGKGFLDVALNDSAGRAVLLYSHDLPLGLNTTAVGVYKFGKEVLPSTYAELQINAPLSKNVNAFGRVETVDWKKPVYLAGVGVRLK